LVGHASGFDSGHDPGAIFKSNYWTPGPKPVTAVVHKTDACWTAIFAQLYHAGFIKATCVVLFPLKKKLMLFYFLKKNTSNCNICWCRSESIFFEAKTP
jgi:hypothetical protein